MTCQLSLLNEAAGIRVVESGLPYELEEFDLDGMDMPLDDDLP